MYMINVSVGLFCFSGRSVIRVCTAVAAKSCQSCQSYPTLCDPVDDSLPGSCLWDSPGKNTGVGCHFLLQCMKVKSESDVAQLCLTLSNPMDCSLPGSSVHGIFQARVLEWVAISFFLFTLHFLKDLICSHGFSYHLHMNDSQICSSL